MFSILHSSYSSLIFTKFKSAFKSSTKVSTIHPNILTLPEQITNSINMNNSNSVINLE